MRIVRGRISFLTALAVFFFSCLLEDTSHSLEADFEKKEKQTNKQKTDTKTKQNNSYFSF